MLKIIHRYLRRFIVWVQTPSDEELAARERKQRERHLATLADWMKAGVSMPAGWLKGRRWAEVEGDIIEAAAAHGVSGERVQYWLRFSRSLVVD